MPDIENLTELKLEELEEFLDNAPFNISAALCRDTLYDLAYSSVIDDLASEAEAREDEAKLEGILHD